MTEITNSVELVNSECNITNICVTIASFTLTDVGLFIPFFVGSQFNRENLQNGLIWYIKQKVLEKAQ